jgi:putative ABC transport system substrate-binding protein
MQFGQLKRRDFIALAGGAAATWPLAARAQQLNPMRRIGVLTFLAADDPESKIYIAAFLQQLQELGWTVGRNVQIDYRSTAGEAELIRKYAAELIALAPDVILTAGGSHVGPLQQATRTVPIVFVQVADAVGGGFVSSLARPGGNATGFTNFEYDISGKWLELLKQIAPLMTRAAVLRDPANPSGAGQFGAIQAVAQSLGVEASPINMRDASKIESDMNDFAQKPNGGLIVTPSSLAFLHRQLIVALAARLSIARNLPVPLVRQQRRPDLLRA